VPQIPRVDTEALQLGGRDRRELLSRDQTIVGEAYAQTETVDAFNGRLGRWRRTLPRRDIDPHVLVFTRK
jgi:hypothetical protein